MKSKIVAITALLAMLLTTGCTNESTSTIPLSILNQPASGSNPAPTEVPTEIDQSSIRYLGSQNGSSFHVARTSNSKMACLLISEPNKTLVADWACTSLDGLVDGSLEMSYGSQKLILVPDSWDQVVRDLPSGWERIHKNLFVAPVRS